MAIKKKKQKILSYYAVFDPAREGGYNVSFPDVPGCVTFGYTFDEARDHAREVLELWFEELASHNQEVPHRTEQPIIAEVRITAPAQARRFVHA